jgi:hypothetical protein
METDRMENHPFVCFRSGDIERHAPTKVIAACTNACGLHTDPDALS